MKEQVGEPVVAERDLPPIEKAQVEAFIPKQLQEFLGARRLDFILGNLSLQGPVEGYTTTRHREGPHILDIVQRESEHTVHVTSVYRRATGDVDHLYIIRAHKKANLENILSITQNKSLKGVTRFIVETQIARGALIDKETGRNFLTDIDRFVEMTENINKRAYVREHAVLNSSGILEQRTVGVSQTQKIGDHEYITVKVQLDTFEEEGKDKNSRPKYIQEVGHRVIRHRTPEPPLLKDLIVDSRREETISHPLYLIPVLSIMQLAQRRDEVISEVEGKLKNFFKGSPDNTGHRDFVNAYFTSQGYNTAQARGLLTELEAVLAKTSARRIYDDGVKELSREAIGLLIFTLYFDMGKDEIQNGSYSMSPVIADTEKAKEFVKDLLNNLKTR